MPINNAKLVGLEWVWGVALWRKLNEIPKIPNRDRDILKNRQQIPNRLEKNTDRYTEKPISTWNTDNDPWLNTTIVRTDRQTEKIN